MTVKRDRVGGSQTFLPVEPRSLHAAVEVRQVLPKLAKKSEQWSRRTICPMCGDFKDSRSNHCKQCIAKIKEWGKKGRPVLSPVVRDGEPQHGFKAHRGHTGQVIPQPARRRMIKTLSGWVPAPTEGEGDGTG